MAWKRSGAQFSPPPNFYKNMSRIIAGSKKNIIIDAPAGNQTRPILARTRKSLFDTLSPRLYNACFLDLYAGSGAVGLEALSRGVNWVSFVEISDVCARIIQKNVKKMGFSEQTEMLRYDIKNLPPLSRTYDIVFSGPPYKEQLTAKTLDIILNRVVLAKDCWVICQHETSEAVPEEAGNLKKFREKKYGQTMLSFYTLAE